MNLTNDQKKEILLKYINPEKDFVKAEDGRILISRDASRKIAESFNLNIATGGQFEPKAICDYIIARERQRLAAKASIERKKDKERQEQNQRLSKIVACLKQAKSEDKSDFEIAKSLYELGKMPFSEIINGVEQAISAGVLDTSNKVKEFYRIFINRSVATSRFSSYVNSTNRDRIIEGVANDLINYYTKNFLSFGHLRYALNDSGLDEEIIDEVINLFYKKYEPFFIERFKGIDDNQELAHTIYQKLMDEDVFDSTFIIDYLNKMKKADEVDDIAYSLYRLEQDEKRVYKILMIKDISLEERVKKLKDLDLHYPISCLKRTFDILRPAYNLPYDEILELYQNGSTLHVEEPAQSEEVIEELIPRRPDISSLNKDGDGFIEPHDPVDKETTQLVQRRLQIIKKEKEVEKIEKKKTLALLLIGAGFIPVAVLALIFKVDPLTASKNCVTALSQLGNGSLGLSGILPDVGKFTALLAGMGTSFVAFVKYLKHRKKINGLNEEIEDIEDMEQAIEEVEEIKKGRR